MFGKLTVNKQDLDNHVETTHETHDYELTFTECNDEGKIVNKIVKCKATIWKIGGTKFIVSKFNMSATGTLTLHIMGVVQSPVKVPDDLSYADKYQYIRDNEL